MDQEIKDVQEKQEILALELNDTGEILAKTDVEMMTAIQRYIKLNLVPKQFKTPYEAMGALLYCKQLGLPATAWSKVAHIHGTYTVFGSLFVAIAKRSPQFGEDRVYFIDDKQEKICLENKNLKNPVWACVVQTKKKDSKIWNEHFFTVDEAKAAGIFRNVWTSYTKDMLYYKAVARSYKFNYADALHGVEMSEDSHTYEIRDIQPEKVKVDLNAV